MTEAKKPTAAEKLKKAEAEIAQLKDAILKLSKEHEHELLIAKAQTENAHYGLGFEQGYAQGLYDASNQKRGFFRK